MELTSPLQGRISEFNNNELIPALAEACDQLVEPNQRVQIERLEIDLGAIAMDKLESEFKDGIVKQFKNQLQRMVLKNPSLVETIQENKVTPSLVTTETESIHLKKVDLFIYFLEHGSIPWWYSTKELKMNVVINELQLNSPKLFQDKLIPLLNSQNIRLRLSQTLTDKQFIQLIDPNDKIELKFIWNLLIRQFQQGFFKPQPFSKVKRTVFEKILSELTFVESNSQRHIKLKKAILQSVIVLQPKRASLIIKSGINQAREINGNILISKLVEHVSSEELEDIFKELTPQLNRKADGKSLILADKKDEHFTRQKLPEDTFLEINNAGIVLLWPYLQLFFEELKLMEDKTFIDDASKWKAIHLLHFLAFGNEVAEEHQWALNKILCGLSISDFVPSEFLLSKAEKAECNNLLQAVINNWEVLKNSSVQGLQQSFLQRNGLLKNDQQGFIVEIERISIDILLDKLSWPLSVIHLPWNNQLIHVKW